MVVGEGKIHHRADHHLAVDGDGALLDLVHAEDAALGRIEDRGAQQGSVDAAVGDGEDAALEVGKTDLSFAGLDGVSEEFLLEPGKGELLAITDDGDDQSLLGADGHPDVVVVVLDEFVPFQLRVDLRNGLQRFDDGLDEEGHEAELHAILGLETLLDLLAEAHDGAHVDLVEGGEDGGSLLGVDQLQGNLAAERGELAAAHTALGPCWSRGRWEMGDGRWG